MESPTVFDDYVVIGEGHTHAGKTLAIGETVRMPCASAERYPAIFESKRAASSKAERRPRPFTSAKPDKSAAADRSNHSTDIEE
jgi:hypothetical protein